MITRRVILALLIAALPGCGKSSPVSPTASGSSQVYLFNGSGVALTDVHVETADGVSFNEARLESGAYSVAHTVGEIHTSPAITLRAGGDQLAAIPVEGFDGFNPRLDPGNYVIVIGEITAEKQLSIHLIHATP
jgi:hypothetical protein